jgi:hypothetical protein
MRFQKRISVPKDDEAALPATVTLETEGEFFFADFELLNISLDKAPLDTAFHEGIA